MAKWGDFETHPVGTSKRIEALETENARLRASVSYPPHGIPPLSQKPLTMEDMMAAADKVAVKAFPVDEYRARIYRAISGADRAALRAVASQLGLTPYDHSEDFGRPYVAPGAELKGRDEP